VRESLNISGFDHQRCFANRRLKQHRPSAPKGKKEVKTIGTCDQRVVARIRDILSEVTEVLRGPVRQNEPKDYRLVFRVYGIDGVYAWPVPPNPGAREIFILG